MSDNYSLPWKYVVPILITAIAVFLFSQFIQKPQVIKKVCDQQALERSVFEATESKIPNAQERDAAQTGLYKKYYESCVILNGANP